MDNKDEEGGVLDPEAPEEGPSAPPSGLLDTVSGYEGTPSEGVGEDKIYPPPSDRVPKPENDRNASVPHVRLPTVSEDTARAALLEYVGSKWTYRSKPAKELVFRDLTPFTAYRYRLETFTESRGTAWAFEPYTNQLVDGPQYGVPPHPGMLWLNFLSCTLILARKSGCPTPHLSRCATDAMGKAVSDAVNVMDGTRCTFCFGSGVKVENIVHFVMDQDVEGALAVQDEVYPIVGFPKKEICDASKRGNDEHMARFSRSMHILQQRQTIELIPLTQAFYEYKEQEYNYFVYGIENKVHAPKYPSSCSIL